MDVSPLRQILLSGIYGADGSSVRDLKGWVSSSSYDVDTILTPSTFSLFVRDTHSLCNALAFDAARFSCASFETALNIKKDDAFPKSTAWASIKMYYAAFFAAHAILRLFGNACSQLERGHLTYIRQLATATQASGTIANDGGFFLISFDETTKLASFTKLNDTHKDTWTNFHKLLKRISNQVLTLSGVSTNLRILSSEIDSIATSLENDGAFSSGNWLSFYRNNVNYKQDYGSWFPYANQTSKFDDVESLITGWSSDSFAISSSVSHPDETKRFFAACCSIIYLCLRLSTEISSRSQSKNNHFASIPLKALRLAGIKS